MQKINYRKSLWVFLALFMHFINADEQAARGWFWYQDPKVVEQQLPPPDPLAGKTPAQIWSEAGKEVENLQAAAVLNPTQANIKAFRDAQNLLIERSTRFGMLAATQNWQDPSSPTSKTSYGGAGNIQDMNRYRDDVASLLKQFGIFYFYTSDCKYCSVQADVMKSMEMQYGMRVVGVSLDGSKLQQFPNSVPDNGISAKAGIPKNLNNDAIVAFDSFNNKLVVVGYGYVPTSSILERLHTLFVTKTGFPDEYLKQSGSAATFN